MQYKLCWPLLLCGVLLTGFAPSHAQRLGGTTADSKMLTGGAGSGGGLSGLYTPNLYDGSATVNIPIYQYSADGSNYGLSLSYSTKGIKVDRIASSAGLGWEMGLPSIQRVLKDLPDELNVEADTMLYKPIYDNYPNGGNYQLNTFFWMKGKYATYSESPVSAAKTNIYRDGEADDFVVTLGGSSFTFNLGKGNFIFTNPRKSVKIELLLNGTVISSIADYQVVGSDEQQKLEFRITDDDGTQYLFVRGDYEQKTITDMAGQGYPIAYYWLTTRWVVKEVTLASGAKISYNYDQLAVSSGYFPAYMSYSNAEGTYAVNTPSGTPERATNPRYAMPLSIIYPNGVSLSFNYDATRRSDFPYGALRSIKVNTAFSCLEYKLMQSFWKADASIEVPYADGIGPASDLTRLRLDSIMNAACDGSLQEPLYRFSYSPVALPKRMSIGQDYFGYYNGASYSGNFSSSPSAIPSHTMLSWSGSPLVYGISRNENSSFLEAGILKKIKNAYGGELSFYYRPHLLGTGPGVNVIDGYLSLPAGDGDFLGKDADDGLCLDYVVEKEPYHADNLRETRFIYSGGQRFLTGGYFYSPLAWSVINGVFRPRTWLYTSTYITPHHLVGGSNHGYSNVTVESRTGTGALLSKKEYTFTNFKDATSGNQPRYTLVGPTRKHYYQYPFTDKQYIREWEMGLPLSITEYDQNNQIVQKTLNHYSFLLDSTSAAGKVENCKAGKMMLWDVAVPGAPTQMASRDSLDYYRPYRGWAQLDTSIALKYFSSTQYVADSTFFAYDGRNKLSTIITTNSKGQRARTVNIYNYSVSTSNASQTIHQMNLAGLEKNIGMERWLVGSSGQQSDKLLDATISTYSFQDGKLLPKALYALESASPLDYSTYTGDNGGPLVPPPYQNFHPAFAGSDVTYFQKTSEVQQSDSKGNPIETLLPMSGQYKAMIWDTLTGQKLAEGACRLADLAYTGFEASHQGSFSYAQIGVTWVSDGPAGRNAYLFNAGPITRTGFTVNKEYRLSFWSTTAPTCTIAGSPITLLPANAAVGNWTYYEGVFIATAPGAALSISGAANKFIDELRLYPTGGTIQNWSYDALFGLRASQDFSGRMTYYEYDKLGRQVLVRDQEGNILSKTEYYIAP